VLDYWVVAGALDDVRIVADSPAGLVEGRSDGCIASRVAGFWDHGGGPSADTQLPSTGMILIVSLGPKMRVATSSVNEDRTVRSFVAGLQLGPATTEHDGDQEGIQVDLTPLAARAIFGVPLHELSNRCIDLDDLVGARIDRLVDELRDAKSWTRRFEVVDRELRRAIAAGPSPAPESRWLYEQLMVGADEGRLGRLVEQTGRSHRHLAAQFKRDVGLAPKAFARLVRFRRAVRLLRAQAPLARASVDAGYYDQAHFTREFQSIGGTTPGRMRTAASGAPEVQFVQDDDGARFYG